MASARCTEPCSATSLWRSRQVPHCVQHLHHPRQAHEFLRASTATCRCCLTGKQSPLLLSATGFYIHSALLFCVMLSAWSCIGSPHGFRHHTISCPCTSMYHTHVPPCTTPMYHIHVPTWLQASCNVTRALCGTGLTACRSWQQTGCRELLSSRTSGCCCLAFAMHTLCACWGCATAQTRPYAAWFMS